MQYTSTLDLAREGGPVFEGSKAVHLSSASPPRFTAARASEITPPPPGDYLIKGIMEPEQTSIWFGPPGTAKSFLLLHLAYAVARGESVFRRKVRQAETLYCALEGHRGIDRRIEAMKIRWGVSDSFWRSCESVQLLECDRGGTRINRLRVADLIDFIRKHNIKLVILDTLNLTIGGSDENDNTAMSLLMKAAAEMAATGPHVAFVAHAAKSSNDSGPRGGGAQKGNADLVVSVTCEEGLSTASSFGPAGKIKDGAPFELNFTLRNEGLETDDDGDVVSSCTVEEVTADLELPKGPKLSPKNQGWMDDITDLFAASVGPHAPLEREVLPGLAVNSLTRDQLREGLRKKGRLGESADKPIEPRLRQQLHDALMALKSAGRIGLTDQYIWLVHDSGVLSNYSAASEDMEGDPFDE